MPWHGKPLNEAKSKARLIINPWDKYVREAQGANNMLEFQVWLSKEGPEKRMFQTPSAIQDATRVSQPVQFKSVVSKNPYFSVTDQAFKGEYMFEYGPMSIKVHVPKMLLSKDELKEVEGLMKNQGSARSQLAANLFAALEQFG